MSKQTSSSGHRARLRQRFLADPDALTETQLLELLLTYAIPRTDVAPLAQRLIKHFGTLGGLLAASYDDLLAISGLGPQTAILFQVIARLTDAFQKKSERQAAARLQPASFEPTEPDNEPDNSKMDGQKAEPEMTQIELFAAESPEPIELSMRTFVNDEIANALTFIPQATQFEDFEAFKIYLRDRLPYNSESTRQRRAKYILDRFFPENRLNVPLAYYAAHCTSAHDLKPAIFYHVLKAEPLAAKVAEEFIWPALPVGYVEREGLREFILRYLPDIGASSQKNVLRSLFTTYELLSVGLKEKTTLRFQVQTGTLDAFLYLLTAQFPRPGIYTFEALLEESPSRRWLLWDRAWMRRQLYNLRDFGLIAKVSEIDAVRQFTLQFDQVTALQRYFEHPQRDTLAIREGVHSS